MRQRHVGQSSIRSASVLACVVVAITMIFGAGPAAAEAVPSVTGTVTMPDGTPLDADVLVLLVRPNAVYAGDVARTSARAGDGAFSFSGIAPGSYIIGLFYNGPTAGVVSGYLPGVSARTQDKTRTATEFVVTTGATVDVSTSLFRGAYIEGSLTAEGGEFDSTPSVSAYLADDVYPEAWGTFDAVAHTYRLGPLLPGDYALSFQPGPYSVRWRGEFWPDSPTLADATRVHVGFGDVVRRDAVLEMRPSIAGSVTTEDGLSGRGFLVSACPVAGGDCSRVSSGNTNGLRAVPWDYRIVLDQPGDYHVCVMHGGSFAEECWPGSESVVSVGEREQVEGVDIVVPNSSELRGAVFSLDPFTHEQVGANGATVVLYRFDETSETYVYYDETTAAIGYPMYTFPDVVPGTYALRFVATTVLGNPYGLNSEYWNDARYWAERTDVVVGSAQYLDLGSTVLDPRSVDVGRIAGADRFSVGVSVAQAIYPDVPADGVPVVYVANGLNFPDALSAGPAASARGGVVLLVLPDAVPAVVADELRRLDPQRIAVVGGPASVSPAVFGQLAGFVDSPADIVRLGGVDRFAASRNIVVDAFGDTGAPFAIIATGNNFPDALAAGPAASAYGAPVILVDGQAPYLDPGTRDLLERLGVEDAYIAGGTASVRPGIEAGLVSLLGADRVTRFAGVDRFDAAAQINAAFFDETETAFVTTGLKFPDAITGGPLAAAFGAPMYLTMPDCLPAGTVVSMLDQQTQGMVILGGTSSVGSAVEEFTIC